MCLLSFRHQTHTPIISPRGIKADRLSVLLRSHATNALKTKAAMERVSVIQNAAWDICPAVHSLE
ncbi:hypothetical protein PILCRDRAFT_450433 [Piloderma croceum F 1598]|uniref:Uncharacterized protein n=1 Tax=Piloderma croceum (strain F 1598) TaxID=765440 RepID=A0A0C3C0M8_PILCF|nr:hypothetical protein PILCRDRAFT_450433 [Piloderma croceum F 1598]